MCGGWTKRVSLCLDCLTDKYGELSSDELASLEDELAYQETMKSLRHSISRDTAVKTERSSNER